MGDVYVLYKVHVEEQDKIDNIKEEIEQNQEFKMNKIEIEEIGFGIKTLKVSYIFSDKQGEKNSQIENFLKQIKGVSDAEVINLTLL